VLMPPSNIVYPPHRSADFQEKPRKTGTETAGQRFTQAFPAKSVVILHSRKGF